MANIVIPHSVSFPFKRKFTSRWGVTSSTNGNTSVAVKWNDTVERSQQNPGWKTQIRNVTQAGTLLQVTKKSYVPTELSGQGSSRFVIQDMGQQPDITGDEILTYIGKFNPIHGIAVGQPSEAVANAKALSMLMKKATQAQRQVSGGVMAGEIRQTLRLLGNPLRGFRRGIDRYLRATKSKARRERPAKRQSVIRDQWLEYSFGWTPLVNDIDDAMHALADINAGVERPPHKVVFGIGTDVRTVTNTSLRHLHSDDYWSIRYNRYRKVEYVVKYLAAVKVDPVPSFTPRYLGVGLRDFLPTVWELIPYSFLVDYFTNVGEIVEAVSFRRSDVAWVMKWVVKEDVQSLVNIQNTLPKGSNELWRLVNTKAGTYTEKTITRTRYEDSLVPSLAFEIPGFGSKKWLNIGALSASLFR